jgi:alpha-glucosidase
MLWASNFISPDNRREYLDYRLSWPCKKPLLLESNEYPGEECIVHWWSGKSVTFDFTNPEALKEFADNLEKFRKEYGFDGFKFDGGDPEFFRGKAKFHNPDARECDFSHAYNQLGLHFPFHEFRIGYKTGGMPIIIRLQDIPHTWKGLEKVLYNAQTAGLMGCPYIIGDMIGGGLSSSYLPGKPFSHKLFIRSCQIQALMPMMQFSLLPTRRLSPEGVKLCRAFADLHVAFAPYILEQVRHAAETGEPVVRAMEYEFPHQGFNRPMQQFMLGDRWLVAPVVTPDDAKTVELPAGRWRDDLGEMHDGPKTVRLEGVPLARLPRYELISAPLNSSH